MKTIVLLCVTFSLAYADPSTTSAGSTETSNKSETKSPNTITSAPASGKTQYYTARTPTFVQLVQKPLFTAHHPSGVPQTMFIIAQPALLPHNLVYNQASTQHAQQLLNYFHSNPNAKYQLLYQYQPHQSSAGYSSAHQQQAQHQHQPQSQHHQQTPVYYATSPHAYQGYQYLAPQQYTYLQPQGIPHQYTQSSQNYQAPHYQIPASTYTHIQSQLQVTPQTQTSTGSPHEGRTRAPFVPSQQLTSSLAQTLHQVSSQLHRQLQTPEVQVQSHSPSSPTPSPSESQAQSHYSSHYYSQGPQTFTTQAPIKSVAPIITGLENFTPEQQAQIKEQLSSHFGGLTQINSNSLQANHPDYQTKFKIEVQSPESEYISSPSSSAPSTQTESNNLKNEAREEEQPTIQHQEHQHQPHYLQQTQHTQQGTFTPPLYTYRTPQYTKG